MASKKTKKGEPTPSADEIIEALAQEMGVDDSKSDDSVPAKKEAAPKAEAPKKASKSDDPMAGLGGIFDVPDASKKKKSAKKTAKKAVEKAEEAVTSKAKEVSSKAKKEVESKSSAGVDAIDSLFNVGKDADDPTPDEIDFDTGDDDELDRLERKAGGGNSMLMIGVIVVLVGALGVVLLKDRLGDVQAVFTGEYRDKKDAEKRRIEEEHLKKQKEALEKYGNLRISGTPNNALIKFQFEGDANPRVIYAQYAPESPFTELRLGVNTIIQNLKVKKPLVVTVEAPGYQSQTVQLNEPMWRETPTGDFQHELNVYLQASNPWTQQELADRMLPFEEDEPAGVVMLTSDPPGAKIKINNRLVVDKDGKPVLAPTNLTMIPPDPAKTDPKTKAEAAPIKVNTPPGQGHKIELFFDDPNMPRYVTAVQRSLWLCKTKDDAELKKLPKDARPAIKCNYEYAIKGDFNAIKEEIVRQKKIEEELRKQKEELERIQKEQENIQNGGKKDE